MLEASAILAAALIFGLATSAPSPASRDAAAPELEVVIELEEDVYSCGPPENGAGPMWAYGSSCIARVGDDVFISGLELLPDAPPLNNVRGILFHRKEHGWELAARAPGRTREPCPIVGLADGTVLLSCNPTLTGPQARGGPARPEILAFSASNPAAPARTLRPVWDGEPAFTEHSYRSFAADGPNRELILFQNIGHTHAEWSFRDHTGAWSAQGRLIWPWGADYPEPQPIRLCYATVGLKDRRVYFSAVSDIVEPYPEWRQYKLELTGRDWDYDFRRLFFTWSDDITTGEFHDWIEVSSRDHTAGHIFPLDLWVGPDGAVHLLWSERALDERLRERFFPEEERYQALMYAVVRGGAVVEKRPLVQASEASPAEMPSTRGARFHVTPGGRLFVFYCVWTEAGPRNRLLELLPNRGQRGPVEVPLAHPLTDFYTATWRNGSPPSEVLDLYGTRAGAGDVYSYARVRIR